MGDIYTTNDEGEKAVRTVSVTQTTPDTGAKDVIGIDDNGNKAIRIIGGGGITSIPIATSTDVGGILSSDESGSLNVDPDTGLAGIVDYKNFVLANSAAEALSLSQEYGPDYIVYWYV